MQTHDFTALFVPNTDNILKELDAFNREGWEPINVCLQADKTAVIFFKRPIKE